MKIKNKFNDLILKYDEMNESNIDSYLQRGNKIIHFPFNSLNPNIHDFVTGENGSFEKIWNLIDYISFNYENEITLILEYTITNFNYRDIIPTYGWIFNFNNAKIKFLTFEDLSIDSEKKTYPKNLDILNKTIEFIKERKVKHPNIIFNSVKNLDNILEFYHKKK
ncbi:hypothetical protein HOD20_02430 [archaeon]|jgi:hypothetical protein|nr:hypothetical protein [Candidatus Woesearchaeota archaeon]MBT3464223.1 hypothetical protein [archaeon]MBT4351364.1 hypothetical protein [archaeon]MBT4647554.1 hypothetical protein [archaeon]MBT6821950.1 hypothetical protein [archaeon]